jgi:hypothetical protein
MEEADVTKVDDRIILTGLASRDGYPGRTLAAIYDPATGKVAVGMPGFGVSYEFEVLPDEPPGPAPFEPHPMRHAVTEAAVAIDDVEGFWVQGKDLGSTDILDLNERIGRGLGMVIGARLGGRWLITFGRGHTYLVEPVEFCQECHQSVDIDEMPARFEPVHTGCFDPAAWAFRD